MKDHLVSKYSKARNTYGKYGNVSFLMELDSLYAGMFLDYVGFKIPNNSVRFSTDDSSYLKNE